MEKLINAKEAYKKTQDIYKHRVWKSEQYDPIIIDYIQTKINNAIEKGDYECAINESDIILYSGEKISNCYSSIADIDSSDKDLILKSLNRVISLLEDNDYVVSIDKLELKKDYKYTISWGYME